MRNHWQTLDTQTLLQRRQQQEQTTSANVGAYPVPLGQPLRRMSPENIAVSADPVRSLRQDDEEFRRALRSMGWID